MCFLPSNKKWERGKRGKRGGLKVKGLVFQYKKMKIRGTAVTAANNIK